MRSRHTVLSLAWLAHKCPGSGAAEAGEESGFTFLNSGTHVGTPSAKVTGEIPSHQHGQKCVCQGMVSVISMDLGCQSTFKVAGMAMS